MSETSYMLIVPKLEAQPAFPAVDLTKGNADELSLMLANEFMVNSGHGLAEAASWGFRIGHPAVLAGAKRLYDSTPVAAVEHGVMVFEAMTVAVAGLAGGNDMIPVNQAATRLFSSHTSSTKLTGLMVDAVDRFKQVMPRTAEAISDASRRFVGPLTTYALLGAALEREIVLARSDVS